MAATTPVRPVLELLAVWPFADTVEAFLAYAEWADKIGKNEACEVAAVFFHDESLVVPDVRPCEARYVRYLTRGGAVGWPDKRTVLADALPKLYGAVADWPCAVAVLGPDRCPPNHAAHELVSLLHAWDAADEGMMEPDAFRTGGSFMFMRPELVAWLAAPRV